jgi:hypothetical protein
MKIAVIFALALTPAAALADPPRPAEYTVGARVGGYGFRQAPTAGADHTGFTDCRMNGIGLFGQKRLNHAFFAEAGLDAYFADTLGTGFHEHGDGSMSEGTMDRVSGLLSVAGGARVNANGRVSPYVQVGAGLELTRVSMPDLGVESSRALPLAFFGFGGDLRITRALRVGMNLRVHVMGHFDHGAGTTELEAEPELAAQGQFYAKWDL